MTLKELIDRVTARGRGPYFAAAVALLAGALAIFTLPPTDRDESRFAEASAQMLAFLHGLGRSAPRWGPSARCGPVHL